MSSCSGFCYYHLIRARVRPRRQNCLEMVEVDIVTTFCRIIKADLLESLIQSQIGRTVGMASLDCRPQTLRDALYVQREIVTGMET